METRTYMIESGPSTKFLDTIIHQGRKSFSISVIHNGEPCTLKLDVSDDELLVNTVGLSSDKSLVVATLFFERVESSKPNTIQCNWTDLQGMEASTSIPTIMNYRNWCGTRQNSQI